ncbi:hypothetical protein [Nocardioides cynanchi]|uniref:hypothetical protein n=1 Tax=Nocardioides cynanchi TaxID=2558918 RepID=UPI0012482002|nr:hypothetical protein [Nocardioides cynanchi]
MAVIDGDNLTKGGELHVSEVCRVLSRIADTVTACPVTFAMQRRLAVRYMTAYSDLGWGVRFASMAADAADVLLHEAAEEYVAHSITDLVVASGDHMFSDLAGSARLHVISYQRSLSRRLELAASTVTFLDDLLPAAT